MSWADRCVVQVSTGVDLVHAFKTMEGLLFLVPPRTPRNSGYDVYDIRSMLLYVICLLHVYVCYVLLYVICLL